MIKVVLFTDLRVYCSTRQAKKFLSYIERELTFDNPEYLSALKSGRWISSELRADRKVSFYEVKRKYISFPREFWYRLQRYFDDNDIQYRLVDRTIKREFKKHFHYKRKTILRPYQEEVVDAAVKRGRGVIVAPCGSGKTEMLTAIIERMNQWTIVLVHTDDLMVQMRNRLELAFGRRIGIIKQNRQVVRSITVASIQTLARRRPQDLPEGFHSLWGVVICDETHHAPVQTWCDVINKFPARHRFGTTATDFRRDKLEPLMFATIGYRVASVSYEELYSGGFLMNPRVRLVDTNFTYQSDGYPALVKALVEDEDRNDLIVDKLLSSRDHHNLVLSGRIDHLNRLHEKLMERAPNIKAEILIGSKTRKERQKVLRSMVKGRINFIFATQLADEGLDIPILDRLHLVFPTRSMGKIMQQCGRVQRIFPGKMRPIVYDYVDSRVRVLSRQSDERLRVYRRMKASITSQMERPIHFEG